MKIFHSGDTGLDDSPETLAPEMNPKVMLTFYTIYTKQKGSLERVLHYMECRKKQLQEEGKNEASN